MTSIQGVLSDRVFFIIFMQSNSCQNTMKRFQLLFPALLAIICTASCVKNDKIGLKTLADTTHKIVIDTTKKPVVTPPQKTLFGRWDLQAEQFVKYHDGALMVNASDIAAGYNSSYVIFKSDSTYSSSSIDWYPALSTFGTMQDNAAGTYHLADTSLLISSYLTNFNTVFYGAPPSAPPVIAPVSDKMVIRQFTDSTLSIHHEYVANCTDLSAGPLGTYKYVWDLYYIKQAGDQPTNLRIRH